MDTTKNVVMQRLSALIEDTKTSEDTEMMRFRVGHAVDWVRNDYFKVPIEKDQIKGDTACERTDCLVNLSLNAIPDDADPEVRDAMMYLIRWIRSASRELCAIHGD